MAAVCKMIVTRPSLSDTCIWELESVTNTDSKLASYWPNFGKQADKITSGFISHNIEELITWGELASRRNELRSDIQTDYSLEVLNEYAADAELYGVGPNWNPFSSTTTGVITFDTLEHGQTEILVSHDEASVARWKGYLTSTGSTWTEEWYVDGTQIDWTTGLFSVAP